MCQGSHFPVVETEVERYLAADPRKHSWENTELGGMQASFFLIPEGLQTYRMLSVQAFVCKVYFIVS